MSATLRCSDVGSVSTFVAAALASNISLVLQLAWLSVTCYCYNVLCTPLQPDWKPWLARLSCWKISERVACFFFGGRPDNTWIVGAFLPVFTPMRMHTHTHTCTHATVLTASLHYRPSSHPQCPLFLQLHLSSPTLACLLRYRTHQRGTWVRYLQSLRTVSWCTLRMIYLLWADSICLFLIP